MIEGIGKGEIAAVLVKDLSRVGRDYLQVGFYTEVMFREKGVRFVAITNGVDSDKRESSEFAPFLNIMNEWYIRDCSRKITSVLRARGMSGKHTSNHCIYGYKKDPNDKDHWIIDEEAAEVVRRIYRMAIEGKGPYEIARILATEKVERPSYYLAQRGMGNHQSNYNAADPYTWRGGTVADILSKQEYMGHTVNFRTYKESYKDKRVKMTPKEDLVIFENTQEAIIDKETWERVQTLRKTIRRTDSIGKANPLTGLMFCADCGAKMYNRMSLSAKNGWLDEQGRVYIIYTVREVQESLCCAEHKAVKLFRELEDIDLIERKRRGLGRPSLIYVKDFSSGLPKAQVQNCPNSNSGAVESAILEQSKPQANKTDKNKTEWNDPDPIYSVGIREQLEDYFYQALEVELLLRLCPDDEDTIYQIVDLLVDTCSTKRKMLWIAGDDKPTEVVRSRLKKLNADHIRFVLDSLAENTAPVRNMKQYLLAMLYNAPTTMNLYYQNKTNHDFARGSPKAG